MNVSTSVPPRTATVGFGATETSISDHGLPRLQLALPVLKGGNAEQLLAQIESVDRHGAWTFFRSGTAIAGFAVAGRSHGLEQSANQLYGELLFGMRGAHLHRIWNYVPRINQETDGLENYRHFCRGRSLAFENEFGPGFTARLPAGSAVGSQNGPLAIAFLGGATPPRHFENPHQVPAFEYPREYGPRAPSFSRATAIPGERGTRIFISGTAAIRGHATVGDGDLAAQLACTLENLETIAATAGAGKKLGRSDGWKRSFKVYVRHASDLAAISTHLDRALLAPQDSVQYLRADVCRSALLVEIEAILSRSA